MTEVQVPVPTVELPPIVDQSLFADQADHIAPSASGVEVVNDENVPKNLKLLNDLTSEAGINKYRQSLLDELDDPEMQHIKKMELRVAQINEEIKTEPSSHIRSEKDKYITRLRKEERRLFGSKADRYLELKKMLEHVDDNDGVEVIGTGARELAEYFLDSSRLYAPVDGVQRFVDPDMLSMTEGSKLFIVVNDRANPIQIPVCSIVSAAGFINWEGRGNKESLGKIVDYASRDTDIPPIGNEIYVFILPDGRTIIESGNAHRVAAAIRKGQKSIGFSGNMYVKKLGFVPHKL